MRLKLVQAGEEILRKQAQVLSRDEILSARIQQLIEHMRDTMRDAPGVGLAAPQIGEPLQLAVIEDRPEYHRELTSEQLHERDRKPVPFHVLINPKLTIIKSADNHFFEGCLSVPGYTAIVPRADAVTVECLNERAEAITIRATGWHARILQHEIDHLQGILYIDRMQPRTFATVDNVRRFWKDTPLSEIRSRFGVK